MLEVRTIEAGAKAPVFTLPAHTGEDISIDSYFGSKNVVLYFYPEDATPGCTREACSFRDTMPELTELNTVVLGVSLDPLDSHQRFAVDNDLNFPLLSDIDAAISKAYDVYREKIVYGENHWGIERTTLVIDTRGQIRNIWHRVRVDKHAREVIDFISKELA